MINIDDNSHNRAVRAVESFLGRSKIYPDKFIG